MSLLTTIYKYEKGKTKSTLIELGKRNADWTDTDGRMTAFCQDNDDAIRVPRVIRLHLENIISADQDNGFDFPVVYSVTRMTRETGEKKKSRVVMVKQSTCSGAPPSLSLSQTKPLSDVLFCRLKIDYKQCVCISPSLSLSVVLYCTLSEWVCVGEVTILSHQVQNDCEG